MSKLRNFELWLKGLLAAAIGGAASGVTAVIVAPETFNLYAGKAKLSAMVISSALFNTAMYLKQSPVPADDPEDKK